MVDKASGTLARRPELDQALLAANRAGDQLVVTKLDRLGRSLEHLIDLSKELQAKPVDLVVLDQGTNTSTAVGRLCRRRALGRASTWSQRQAEAQARGPGRSSWPARCTRKPTTTANAATAAEFGVTRPTTSAATQTG